MSRDEPEDARFDELMAREFPVGLTPSDDAGRRPDAEPSGTSRVPPESPATDSAAQGRTAGLPSDFRRWTPPDEPDEPFIPPSAPPGRRWSTAGIAGTALVVLPLVLVVLAAFGVQFPTLVSVLSGLGFFLGVFLLLQRLRQRPPVDGDGAVV
ncbi:MAG: hypothetical protein QM695_16760 [Micropruina sp.]